MLSDTMDYRRLHFSAPRRFAALACAAVFLAGGMETFPQALALAAWLEGSHAVYVARDGGQVTVMLSHERGLLGRLDFTPRHPPGSTVHRHGAATRILCVFVAQRSPRANHVACFATGSICENLTRVIEARATGMGAAVADLATTVSCEIDCSPAPAFPASDFSQPRPPDSLRLLRSTVLVI